MNYTRVKTAHATLKRLLQNSISDLCNAWDAVNNMIILQHTEIKASFERSFHVVPHKFNVSLYRQLRGKVAIYALGLIAVELERVKYVGIDKSRCGCVFRSTYGLPCACALGRYVAGSIPIDTIHVFWKSLAYKDHAAPKKIVSIQQEIDDI